MGVAGDRGEWDAARASLAAGKPRSRQLWVLASLAVVAAALTAGVGRTELVKSNGLRQLGAFFAAAAHPRGDLEFLALTLEATLTTLAYAVLGTALALVIGLVGGVLCSQTWWYTGARGRLRRSATAGWLSARTALAVPRGIHEALWGLILLSILGIQPLVAVLAIGLPFGAVTAKVYSELLDETARPQYSALVAAGASRRSAILYGLLPPALPDLVSYGFYRLECAIRGAAILGLIGAGGLGFQLMLSFQSLRYQEIWTLLYALIGLCAGADLWSSMVRKHYSALRQPSAGPSAAPEPFIVGSILVAGALVPLSAWLVQLDVSVLWAPQTVDLARQLAARAWPPVLGPGGLAELVKFSALTLAMSVLAIALAMLAGTLLAFPAANLLHFDPRARRSRPRMAARVGVVVVTRAVLILLRAIPPPIWALVLLFVLYPGLLPGALALGVYTTGVLGRLMAEAAENIDPRPLRALRAHGAPALHVICYGVIPPAAPRFLAFGLYRWEVTIRETVVVGVVGAGGLGLLLDHQMAAFDYSGATTTLLALVALTLTVDLISASARRSLR